MRSYDSVEIPASEQWIIIIMFIESPISKQVQSTGTYELIKDKIYHVNVQVKYKIKL